MIGATRVPPTEDVLEPDLPIVDAHHHLWSLPEHALAASEARTDLVSRALAPMRRRHVRYLLDEFLADATSGHNIRASVYVDANAMYRVAGPVELRSLGEVEFASGVAAMAASGVFGEVRACAAIVGRVDLSLGAAVEDILAAHTRAGGGRYRGVRVTAFYDEDPRILGGGSPHRLLDKTIRAGVRTLGKMGLLLEVAVLEPQLADVVDLARAVPDVQVVLDHVGTPVGIGRHAGEREARFPTWRTRINDLARCANVSVKLGGLGIPFGGFPSYLADPPLGSEALALEWRPYIETCIEAFGPERCMFESNFPPDSAAASYRTLWNAFKRITRCASDADKAALYGGTATRVYRLEL